jgi:Flp pilus assembly protein TadD
MLHILIARAMLNKEHPSYSAILRELALAEKSAPADADVFFLRGKVLLASGRQEEAISALRRSIELRPMEPGPYYQLAKLYQKLGKTDMAREQFERVKYLEAASPNRP